MKKLICLLLLPTFAQAAPFLVSDPAPVNSGATHCVYQEGTATPVVTPLVALACKADLAGVTVGAHNLQVWFRSDVWGTDSAKVPFGFSRPGAGGTGPENVRVEK